MRLAKLSEFRRLVYTPDSAPSLATLRTRIHEIPGGRFELGRYFVDLDEYDRIHGLRQKSSARQAELKKDPLLEGLV